MIFVDHEHDDLFLVSLQVGLRILEEVLYLGGRMLFEVHEVHRRTCIGALLESSR